MTLDDLKALAEKAKAWWPDGCRVPNGVHCSHFDAARDPCDGCVGAKRACEDMAKHVDYAYEMAERPTWNARWLNADRHRAINNSQTAARLASYFGSESNPVAEFAAAVREFCK